MEADKSGKKEAILRAALELVAEHGFHGAPTALIAERACVGMGTIYRYFSDKDMLIYEIFRKLELKIHDFVNSEFKEEYSYRQRFVSFCTVLLQYLIENAREFQFLEQFFNSPYGVALRRDRIFAESLDNDNRCILKDLYEQGMDLGVIKEVPQLLFIALVVGPIIDIVRDHILGFINLEDGLIGSFVEACWDSVRK
ncbi:MAG TPA: TetR/AcrR family transcriptional regulator [Geobacteraceae bacterium]|nr:TetR/AcrR family transcriptional regulator [Geobacteraceae bacterium]